ncbi:hypothetical protein PUNSTDRAFT_95251 [Punctularia strigosozonata HHB-11173 SS5]|uniref:uncharacterized protein n=1 Tax=Punctularia strigosozonata (strain HHB-11173) TaxID=741275 RepID=UPI00044175FC|nr:uncharacterized protein PUNSTDRAFT_95251 [Punctularia strigosozonata HHB-11173 SS5]EIN13865.1 hypothetical protein PUNSTDRAFT_95251 [Punctularia strigosozonata HHB-11173 SS5]
MRAVMILSAVFALLFVALAAALPPTGTTIQRITGPYAARAAAAPASSSSPSAVRRSPARRDVAVQNNLVAPDLSTFLCPSDTHACPIDNSPMPATLLDWMYECVDFATDLTSCGGCSALDSSRDCTAIPNALAVSCVRGGCAVQSCEPGYIPSADGKTCLSVGTQL